MEAIKKKIETLRSRLAQAESKAKAAEDELQEIIDKADNADGVLEEDLKTVDQLQNEIDDKEEQISNLSTRLLEAEKNLEESVRAVSVLESRTSTDTRKYGHFAGELEKVTTKNQEVEEEFERVSKEIDVLEVQMGDAEERRADGSEKIKELEAEVTRIGHDLKRMEISEGKASVGEVHSSTKIEQLSKEYEDMSERADIAEARVKELENELGDLEIQVEDARSAYNKKNEDYNAMLAELAEM